MLLSIRYFYDERVLLDCRCFECPSYLLVFKQYIDEVQLQLLPYSSVDRSKHSDVLEAHQNIVAEYLLLTKLFELQYNYPETVSKSILDVCLYRYCVNCSV